MTFNKQPHSANAPSQRPWTQRAAVAGLAVLTLIGSALAQPVETAVLRQLGDSVAPVLPILTWEQVPGCAKTIAAAAVNQVMVVGCGGPNAADSIYEWKASGASGQFVPEPPGTTMVTYRRDGFVIREDKRVASKASWLTIDGAAGRAYAIGPDATLYVRNLNAPSNWVQFIGTQLLQSQMQLTAVASKGGTSNGELWAVSAQPAGNGGNQIYQTTSCPPQDQQASGKCWRQVEGAAQKVAQGSGDVWVVNALGGIFKRVDSTWQQVEGCARDITANAGHVYVVGCDFGRDGGSNIYRRVGETWRPIHQTGKALAVDVAGNLWIVKATGDIWRRKSTQPDVPR